MNKTVRNVAIAGAGLLAISAWAGVNKVKRTAAIFETMDIEPHYITKPSIDWKTQRVSFYLDIILTNNSNDDLFLSGLNIARLKRVKIFIQRELVAVVNETLAARRAGERPWN